MTSLNKNDLIRLADLNLVDFWCQSAKWIPHPEILHTRDRVFIHAALDFPACSFQRMSAAPISCIPSGCWNPNSSWAWCI